MNNKKSLLQDSLQELENIKNESLELAKEQLINESADLLEKKSAALFEKLIAGKDAEEEEEDTEEDDTEEEGEESLNEILSELTDLSEEEEEDSEEEEMDSDEEEMDSDEEEMDSDEEEMDSDEEEMDSDEEEMDSDEQSEMSLDDLRKAAEEQGFKLVADSDDEEEIEDSDDEEDIEFNDVDVDDKVLASPSKINEDDSYLKDVDNYKWFVVDLKKKKAVTGWEFKSDATDSLEDYGKDSSNFKVVSERTLSSMGIENPKERFKKMNENKNMRNTKKQVLKDLRDVSFNKLVEAYYNMDESDSFVIKENYEEDDYIDIEDDPEFERRMSGKKFKPSSRELKSMKPEKEVEYDPYADVRKGSEYDDEEMDENYEEDYIDIEDDPEFMQRMSGKKFKPSSRELKSMSSSDDEYNPYGDVRKGSDYGDEEMDEEIMYEIDMPMDEENYGMDEESYGMDEMSDMEINEMLAGMDIEETMHDVEETSGMDRLQKGARSSELEEMFNDMTMEELEEMNTMLHEDGEGDGEGMSFQGKSKNDMKFQVNPEEDYSNLTEAEIEEMLDSMKEEDELDESSLINSQTQMNRGNRGGGNVQGRRERRSGMISEEGMEDQMQEGDEQLDEFFGGAKAALGKLGSDISKFGSTARQAVGQYAQELGRQYNSGEVANEVKKLETLAMNLGKQVGALNTRLQKAGKQPLPAANLITALANQIKSGGNISFANTKAGQSLQEEEVQELQEQLKKVKQENKSLNEGFTNKVKSLENKVYDVTISALKAGFVNKFLLEHPLRENEKLLIIHRFANAQTKEQIKETYISLTNEFAKGQTVKDGSMLNESVQNKVGKVHRTDNAIVTEKNLMNENDETNRFKQLLNYNFNKKK